MRLQESPGGVRGSRLIALEEALALIAGAAEHGYHAFMAAAERSFVHATGARDACIIAHSAGAWHRWDQVDEPGARRAVFELPPHVLTCRSPLTVADGLFVPIRPGVLAALIKTPREGTQTHSAAASLAIAAGFALTALERKRVAAGEGEELGAMQRVALRILKSVDLQEIFLLITHEARALLDADICGILLREGDSVVMQHCIGNFSTETASLRMSAGQGVAGRVVATKQPCCVEDYVGSSVISNDFFSLARDEMVRSALAAPLMSADAVIGVLEVWRRQTSKFENYHTQRLVTLANLTSLAIENARLSQARQAMVAELAETNRALSERYEVIRASAALQNELIRLQLEGKSLAHVAAKASAHVSGAAVLILDANLAIEGAVPERDNLSDDLRAAIKTAIRRLNAMPAQAAAIPFGAGTLLLRSASAGSEILGFVVLLCDAVDEGIELALSQICTATSLHLIERRAAGRARAATLSAVLWDLLEGSQEVRRFALARAHDLHVDLEGRHRIYLGRLGGIEQHAASEGWSANELSACRRRIANAYRDVAGLAGCAKLVGLRGNSLALICGGAAMLETQRVGHDLALTIAAHVPGLSVHIGVSSPTDAPAGLACAYREARISIEVARQRGPVAAASYEDAGIVGLLLSLRDDADVRKLVRTILGALLDLKADDRDRLLGTLAVFFELNCSRNAAAERLGIHEKTVAYRLAKIQDLTGLDFGKHEKRLLADIALRMHGMTADKDAWTNLSAVTERSFSSE